MLALKDRRDALMSLNYLSAETLSVHVHQVGQTARDLPYCQWEKIYVLKNL